jgi:pyruvate dehydrogenase E2 component (dihydrolipoamide acetyltransferase)
MGDFRMPSLGADMSEGTLLEWHVHPGDAVHRGDIIATVDTSKSAIDIEVFEDGQVEELLVAPGATVAVGTPIARISDGGLHRDVRAPEAQSPLAPSPEAQSPAAEAPKVTAPAVESPAAEKVVVGRPHASPLARRRAAELGIDLGYVQPARRDGVIGVGDVDARAAEIAAAASTATVTVPPAPAERPTREPRQAPKRDEAAMRQAIASLMARSKREIPHYYCQQAVDLHLALAWLQAENSRRPVAERILPAALLLKAAARAARSVPEINGFCVDGSFTASARVHLGVAVSLRGGGLIAPALLDADDLPLAELMTRMKDLVTRARGGRLKASEMSDATVTVTNLGEQGVESVLGVIYPPQVAVIGFGRIAERPWAVDGMLTVRPVVTVTLAADHRVSDGHRGGQALAAIEAALQAPENL